MDVNDISNETNRLEYRLQKAVRSRTKIPKDHVPILEAAALEVAELEHYALVGGPHVLLWSSFLHHLWRQIPGPEEGSL